MRLRPLLLDDKNRSAIKRVVEYAHKNPFTIDNMLDVMNKQMPVAGDMAEYTCNVDFGYRVVFSIEKQVKGDVFHLSALG